MGFMDNVKKAAEQAKQQAAELAGKHGSTIDSAISRTGAAVDQRTGGKYTSKIAKAQDAARTAREKVAAQDAAGDRPTTPPTTPPPGPGTTPPPPPPGPGTTPPPPPPGQGA